MFPRFPKNRFFAFSALLLILASSGCTSFHAEDQKRISDAYYAGQLSKAADLAETISRKDFEGSSSELMWHLESGNVSLAAGRNEKSLQALHRAERMLYKFDGEDHMLLHQPGNETYTGSRSDRLLLHLLKGFVYLERGEIEDFLVEMRRMRVSQFRYLTNDADPEIREYEKKNRTAGVIPYRMKKLFQDELAKQAFQLSGMSRDLQSYSARKRPEMSLLFHPLGFYLSAVGYYFDGDWDEALIDLSYLSAMDPQNTLFRRDLATVASVLGDKSANGKDLWKHDLSDQVVYVIYAQGRMPGWKQASKSFRLPGQVLSEWFFSYPENTLFRGGSVEATSGNAVGKTVKLADLGEIAWEEFWQKNFSGMIGSMVSQTRAMTAQNTAAKAALAAAMASPNDNGKILRIAAAAAWVKATEKVSVDQREWRRWSTLPRHYSVLHLPLGKGLERKITLTVRDPEGKEVERKTFVPDEDANRVVIFIRELDHNKRYCKFWSSRE